MLIMTTMTQKQHALGLQGAAPGADSAPSSAGSSSSSSSSSLGSPYVRRPRRPLACFFMGVLVGPNWIDGPPTTRTDEPNSTFTTHPYPHPQNTQHTNRNTPSNYGPGVELVLHKDGASLSETVRAHDLPYGATLRLAGVEVRVFDVWSCGEWCMCVLSLGVDDGRG